MLFWRIVNNAVVSSQEVPIVGFDIQNTYYQAPQDYLDKREFLIFRTALGVGDWVMLERLPYALKKKYPDCKVYLPSPAFIKQTLGFLIDAGQWNSWGDPSTTVELVFKNNPYIDGYVDEWYTEVYHDHFRVRDSSNYKITLTQQLAKFHGIDYEEVDDTIPKLYFDKIEIEEGDSILDNIKHPFQFLHISDRYTEKDSQILLKYMEELNILGSNFVTYYNGDISKTAFGDLNIIRNIVDIKNPRIQFYIKSKAENVIGVQTGATDVVSGLTQVHSLHHSKALEDTWRVGNFIPTIKYINRKDYE